MNTMSKRWFAAAALGVAAAAAFAASAPRAYGCTPSEAHAAARQIRTLAAAPGRRDPRGLEQALHLAPEQQAAWSAYAATLQAPLVPTPPQDTAATSAPERYEQALAWAQAGEKQASERLVAMKSLYAQLTPEQRRTFDAAQGRHGHWPHG